MTKPKPTIELDKRELELQHAKEAMERAQAQVKALAEAQPLTLVISVNRLSGNVSYLSGIGQSGQAGADVDMAVAALDLLLSQLRREQLKLAEQRGKQAAGQAAGQAADAQTAGEPAKE